MHMAMATAQLLLRTENYPPLVQGMATTPITNHDPSPEMVDRHRQSTATSCQQIDEIARN